MTNKFDNLNGTTKNIFRGMVVLTIFFLMFFAINVIVSILRNKSQSAYDTLTAEYEKSQPKLQDTRVHNWDELQKKK